MVLYKVQIVYHIRCTCKSWIPKFNNGKGKFPDLVECPKCHTQWRVKDLLEPPINAMIMEKVFDSQVLLLNQIEYGIKKNMDKEQANAYAIIVVKKQQKIFEEKYSIPVGIQTTL